MKNKEVTYNGVHIDGRIVGIVHDNALETRGYTTCNGFHNRVGNPARTYGSSYGRLKIGQTMFSATFSLL